MKFTKLIYVLEDIDLELLTGLLDEAYTLYISFDEGDGDGVNYRILVRKQKGAYRIFGVSHCGSNFFKRHELEIDREVSLDKLESLFPLIEKVETEDPPYEEVKDHFVPEQNERNKVEWTRLVSALVKAEKIKCTDTDHEFREDTREITWMEGLDLTRRFPVDALGHGNECGLAVEKKLLEMAEALPEEKAVVNEEVLADENVEVSIQKKMEQRHLIDKIEAYELLLPYKTKHVADCFVDLALASELERLYAIVFPQEIKLDKKDKFGITRSADAFDQITVEMSPGERLTGARLLMGFSLPRNRGVRERFVQGKLESNNKWMFNEDTAEEYLFEIKRVNFPKAEKVHEFSFFERPWNLTNCHTVTLEVELDFSGRRSNFKRRVYLRSYMVENYMRDKLSSDIPKSLALQELEHISRLK